MPIDPNDTINLLKAFREGDEDAFATIYDEFYFLIYQYAKRWLQSKEDAEDVTSETFVKLYARRQQFENLENVFAFLKITARNNCFNILKHAKIKSIKQAELFSLIEKEQAPDFSWIEVKEGFIKLVYAEVDKLPAKMKEIFLLAYRDGLKPAEIAERLDLNVQTVSNQKSNAIRILKSALGDKALLIPVLMLLEKGLGLQ